MFFTYMVWTRKYDMAIKNSKFYLVVEYPIWVSIKRTLTGKLAVGGRNFIYSAQVKENVQKLSKSGRFQQSSIFEGFLTFSSNWTKLLIFWPSTANSPLKVLLIDTHIGYSTTKFNFVFLMAVSYFRGQPLGMGMVIHQCFMVIINLRSDLRF